MTSKPAQPSAWLETGAKIEATGAVIFHARHREKCPLMQSFPRNGTVPVWLWWEPRSAQDNSDGIGPLGLLDRGSEDFARGYAPASIG